MADDFHKPTLFGGREFEAFAGTRDPAATMRIAHDTARALLKRVRDSDDPSVIDRVVELHRRARARRARGAVGALRARTPCPAPCGGSTWCA